MRCPDTSQGRTQRRRREGSRWTRSCQTQPQRQLATPSRSRSGATSRRPERTLSTPCAGSVVTRGSGTATASRSSRRTSSSPSSWSQNATNIVAQKYFRGQFGSPEREHSVKQMISRVAGTIAGWGRARGYFATDADGDSFEAELTHILLHQLAAFNSPVWFNVGFEESRNARRASSSPSRTRWSRSSPGTRRRE